MTPAKNGYLVATALAALSCLVAMPATALVDQTERMELSDGVGLATRIILPDDSGGPWPTLFARTPYSFDSGTNAMIQEGLELAAGLGYAIVVQDARGTGKSEGDPEPFLTDRQDGQEALLWTLSKPWCDGRVLMVGASALAIPGYLMAPGAEPGMICQLLAIATPDIYGQAAYQGGVLREADVDDWTGWLGISSLKPEIIAHRDCDSFWDSVRVTGLGADVHAAAVHAGGWYDLFLQGTIDGFRMYRQSADPWAAQHQYLVIGPWSHHVVGEAKVGQLTMPESAKWNLLAQVLAWVNWCFYGWSDVIDTQPPVQYWIFGAVDEEGAPGNEWRYADDWPPFETIDTPLHLTGGGGLTDVPPVEAAEVSVPFDPADPSPTRGGRNLAIASGPYDQAPLVESRSDAILFSSEPLAEPLEVVGRASVRLRVSTDGPDADVAVRLTDVYPDGRSMLIADGIARLSRREGCLASVAVAPGEAVDVVIDLWSISWIFNAGHRIRVVVTGGNHPRFEINPALQATADQPATPITLRIATGPDAPSALLLPLRAPEPPDPDPVPELASETAPEAVAEPVPEPAPEPAPEAAPEPAPEPLPDSAAEPVAEAVVADVPAADEGRSEILDPGALDTISADDGATAADVVPAIETRPASGGGCSTTATPGPMAGLAMMLLVLGFFFRVSGKDGNAA